MFEHTRDAKEIAGEHLPQYYCRCCSRCCSCWCSFYNRHVIPTYNKCFNHSYYHPVSTYYREPPNLGEIIEEMVKAKLAAAIGG